MLNSFWLLISPKICLCWCLCEFNSTHLLRIIWFKLPSSLHWFGYQEKKTRINACHVRNRAYLVRICHSPGNNAIGNGKQTHAQPYRAEPNVFEVREALLKTMSGTEREVDISREFEIRWSIATVCYCCWCCCNVCCWLCSSSSSAHLYAARRYMLCTFDIVLLWAVSLFHRSMSECPWRNLNSDD